MLKLGKKPLAMLLATALLLCACPLTALAEEGGFMGIAPTASIVFNGNGSVTVDGNTLTSGNAGGGTTTANGTWSVDANGVVTTNDATNTVSGDGTNNGLHFTNNGGTTVTVNGNTTVGHGIEADGNLTITGDTSDGADTLAATGNDSPGIGVSGTLNINGGVTVTANGQGTLPGYVDPSAGVMVGGDLNVNNGTLTATGAPSSGGGDTSMGIKADGNVYVNGVLVSLPAGNESTTNGGKGAVTLTNLLYVDPNTGQYTLSSNNSTPTADEIGAVLKLFAQILAEFDKSVSENSLDVLFYFIYLMTAMYSPIADIPAGIASEKGRAFATALSAMRNISSYVSLTDAQAAINALRALLAEQGYYPIPAAAN